MELDPLYTILPKWIKDLNVRTETINIPEKDTGNNFSDINLSNILQDRSPEAGETKAKINLGLHQSEKLLPSTAKEITQENEKTACRMGEDISK